MSLLLLWLELCTSKIKLNRIDCHGVDGSHGNTNMMCEYIWSPKYRNGVFSVQSNTYYFYNCHSVGKAHVSIFILIIFITHVKIE